jgi:hypothetical protein
MPVVFRNLFIIGPVIQLSKIAKSATQVRSMTVVLLNPQEKPFGSCFIWLKSNLYSFATVVSLCLFVSAHFMQFYGFIKIRTHFHLEFSMKTMPCLSALSFEMFSTVLKCNLFCIVCNMMLFWLRNPIMHNELDDHSVDEDNEEYVRPTIIWNDEFSFQTDLDVSVLREGKINEILDVIEDDRRH